jgi:hypothetical protein
MREEKGSPDLPYVLQDKLLSSFCALHKIQARLAPGSRKQPGIPRLNPKYLPKQGTCCIHVITDECFAG